MRTGEIILPPATLEFLTSAMPQWKFDQNPHIIESRKKNGDPILKIRPIFRGTYHSVWTSKISEIPPEGMVAFLKNAPPGPKDSLEVLSVAPKFITVKTIHLPEEEMLRLYDDPFLWSKWICDFYQFSGRDIGISKFKNKCMRCLLCKEEHQKFWCQAKSDDCIRNKKDLFVNHDKSMEELKKFKALQLMGYSLKAESLSFYRQISRGWLFQHGITPDD